MVVVFDAVTTRGPLVQPKRRVVMNPTMQVQIAAIGGAAGVVLALLGLHPTAIIAVDAILLVAASAFVTWCAATAPYWMITMTATIGTALVPPGWRTILGLSLVLVSAVVGAERRSRPIHQAVLFAGTLVLLGLIGNRFQFGWSTVISVVLVIAVAVTGMQHRPRRDRRIAQYIVAGVAVYSVVAVGLAGFAGLRASDGLQRGATDAQRGVNSLRRSNLASAAGYFDESARNLSVANESLSQPWVQPARLVPIVSQYLYTAQTVSKPAAASLRTVSTNLSQIDTETLKPDNGKVDLDAVRALEVPLADVQKSMANLGDTLSQPWSPWLPQRYSEDLGTLSTTLDKQAVSSAKAMEAVQLLPSLLGADGPRHYFVMFTTPAEARGQGGFMGNYAELSADDGQIEIVAFGRHSDLNKAMNKSYKLTDAPADWLERFGPYGFASADDGYVVNQAWSIIDMSAHFPNTAQVIAELYPESGGTEIDGVFSLDVYGVQALIDLVGPVRMKGAPKLDGENTADYLLLGQYLTLADDDLTETNTTRIDMLGRVALNVTTRILGGEAPDLVAFGREFAPLAGEGRVLGWSTHPDEQQLFERINIDGRVLDDDALANDQDGDSADDENADDEVELRSGIQVVVNNAGGSKIDNFLRRKIEVNGGQATVTFTNTAPTTGYPNYVIGSAKKASLPKGSSRLLVTVYSTSELTNFAVNGTSTIARVLPEADRLAYDFQVEIPSMASAIITFDIADPDPINILQPLVKTVDQPTSLDGVSAVPTTEPLDAVADGPSDTTSADTIDSVATDTTEPTDGTSVDPTDPTDPTDDGDDE